MQSPVIMLRLRRCDSPKTAPICMYARANSFHSVPNANRGLAGAFFLLHSAALVIFFSAWHWSVTGGPSLNALAVFTLVVGLSFAFGRLVLQFAPLPIRCRDSLNLQFFAGYLLLNTLLYALSLASPFTATINLIVAGTCALVVVVATRGRLGNRVESGRRAPELLALVLSATGATLWCSDGLDPLVRDGSNTIFRLWGDSFVHARHISAFMHAQGFATLSDIRMADAPAFLYHYACYAIPGIVAAISQSGAYETFASFLLPVGILLTGLAAYSLACSMWGAWPGVAATVAILLIPDAYQQGFGNKYLSYNFMQQVNVAGLYGVALASLAWIFILDGCRKGTISSLAIGWFIVALTLTYKAHIFVANALLVLIYPCLFFTRVKPAWRIGIAAAFVTAFALALLLSGHVDRIPTLRFDGSGAATYLANVASNYDPGWLGRFFQNAIRQYQVAIAPLYFYGAAMLLLSTFGAWLFVAIPVAVSLRKTLPNADLWFPLVVAVNYLAMSLGLALDTKEIGSPDELLNRPLVWAYFAVAAWSGGAAYLRFFGEDLPKNLAARVLLLLLLILSFAGPLINAANLQTFPRWVAFESFRTANSVPTCLIAASRYLRESTRPDELIQDSENDSRLIVSALSERQAFAMFAINRPPDGLHERIRDLAILKRMSDASDIRRFAAERKIAWYLLRPESQVAWPASFLDAPAFACEGYRVYRLDR